MSYARFGNDSDVYIYGMNEECYMIHVTRGESYTCTSLQELKDKCFFLRKSGVKIPRRVFERIEKELKDGTKAR